MKRLIAVALASLLFAVTASIAAQQKPSPTVAVAATGNSVAATVSDQPGRAPFFLFFDKQGAFIEAVSNPAKDAGTPGPAMVDFLAAKAIKVVVAGAFGPPMVDALKSKGIRHIEINGNAKDAAKKALELK